MSHPGRYSAVATPNDILWLGPMHLTGKQRDTESSLDYFGARYFSNQMGRWMSPDEGFADQHPPDPQSWNLYSYTRDNPLRNIDPNGRGVIDWQAVSQMVRNWFSGGVARDGGVGNFAKNNAIGAAKGAGTFALNTARAAVAAGQATSPGGAVGAVQTMTAPLPVALTASNQTQAQASTATQVGLTIASAVVPLAGGGGAVAEGCTAAYSGSLVDLDKSLASLAQMAEPGSPIAGAGADATLNQAGRLAADYGGDAGDWSKMTSSSYTASDGTQFQTHWYQNDAVGSGKIEPKSKFPDSGSGGGN